MHIRLRDHLGQRVGEVHHELLRRACGGVDAVVRQVFKALEAQLIKRGHIGHGGLAAGAEHGHHMHLACLVVLDEILHRAHTRRDLVAQHVSHHGRAAAVGGRDQVDLVLFAHQLDQELGRGGRGRNAHRPFALALRLHPGHVVGERPGRGAARDGERIHERGKTAHRHKVVHRVVTRVLHHLGQDGDGVVVRQEQRVPVGRCGLEGLRRNLPACAGAVFHHHGHVQFVLELFGQQAGNGITAAAGRKAHQNAHRFGRLGTGQPHGKGRAQHGRGAHGAGQQAAARGMGCHGMAPADVAIKTARHAALRPGVRGGVPVAHAPGRVQCRPACCAR